MRSPSVNVGKLGEPNMVNRFFRLNAEQDKYMRAYAERAGVPFAITMRMLVEEYIKIDKQYQSEKGETT